jgi:hypothetical protein
LDCANPAFVLSLQGIKEIAMRVVIHDEETLEPITVVTLPGLTEKNLERKRHWRVSVHDGANEPREMPAERAYSDRLRFVDLTFMEDMVIISVDDHITEPPTVFDNQLSGEAYATAPKLKTVAADGANYWEYQGKQMRNVALNSVTGRVRGIRLRADQPRPAAQGLLGRSCARRRHGRQRHRRVAQLPQLCRHRRRPVPRRETRSSR